VEKIAAHFNWTPQTVREVLHKWQKLGREGFWELSGRGGKPKWKEADIEFLTECLKNEPRTYNSVQLAQKLEKERSIKRASRPIKTNTKKKGFIWKRARKSHKGKQEIIARQIKLFRPRSAGMGCCCGRDRFKIFR
jgi:transposase